MQCIYKVANLQVIKSQYTGGTRMENRGKEVMIIEEHTSCKCDCRIKEQDCNRFQKYDKSQCKCYCQNVDEQHKCLQVSLGGNEFHQNYFCVICLCVVMHANVPFVCS